MNFNVYNKALAALVVCGCAVASLVFKQDLSGYGDIITGTLVGLTPILVYAVPNAAAALADGGKLSNVEQLVEDVAEGVEKNILSRRR